MFAPDAPSDRKRFIVRADEKLTAFVELERRFAQPLSKNCAVFRKMCEAMWQWNLLNIKMDTILIFAVVSLMILQFGVDVNSRHESN